MANAQISAILFGARSGPVAATNTASPVDGTDLTTYTFTAAAIGAAAADRIVAVSVSALAAAGAQISVSSMTIGGVTATFRAGAASSTTNTTELWTAIVPTGTTANVVVTWSRGVLRCGAGVFRIVGAKSETPYATATNVALGTVSTTITVPPNGSIVMGVGMSDNAAPRTSTATGVTEDYDATIEGGSSHTGGHVDSVNGEVGRTISATFSGTVDAGAGLVVASWGPP